ncbi:carbon-nitrogen hydrolase [Flagelloscypha sp. PMI_526]|nr:carbon-nitrogen hydrolase [Flagelloscypha sp. PMI_526]
MIRVSVVQSCPVFSSLEATLAKMAHFVTIAKERDRSEFAVFPEAFIGGYPKYSTFGTVIGERSDAGRDEFLRYHRNAIDVPSPTTDRMVTLSKDSGIFLVVGVIEKEGGTLYCTHRKLTPTGSERLCWGQGDGSTLPVLPFSSNERQAKVSATICWENYMPLLRYFYYQKGVELYCAPTVDARPVWENTMVHIALEGRCFVLAACQFSTEGDYPEEHPVSDAASRSKEKVMIAGGSLIVSPSGKVLAGPLRGKEDVLTAEIDLDDCIRGKFDLDVVGHYARPDGSLKPSALVFFRMLIMSKFSLSKLKHLEVITITYI